MDRLPFKFKDDQERIQAGHEREKTHSWMDGHVSDIINVHDKVKHHAPMTTKDLNLIDIILQNVVSDIFHKRADQEFLLRQLEENRPVWHYAMSTNVHFIDHIEVENVVNLDTCKTRKVHFVDDKGHRVFSVIAFGDEHIPVRLGGKLHEDE